MSKIKFLDLGRQPIANGFLTKEELEKDEEFFFDLSLSVDEETNLVSLTNFVEPEKMFNDSYHFHTSASPVMVSHFRRASRTAKDFKPKKVLEIGSNDGAFLKNFDTDNAICVEPCGNFANYTRELGYTSYNEFWDRPVADKILKEHGRQDLIYSANCMCHIEDIVGAFKNVQRVLSKDGVFIFEDPNLFFTLMRNSYDQVYDEHAHLFSCCSLVLLLRKAGLKMWKIEPLENIHGGSCRIYATHRSETREGIPPTFLQFELSHGLGQTDKNDGIPWPYKILAQNVEVSGKMLKDKLFQLKNKDKKIISYGATSKSTTIFNYCKIGTKTIDYITDTTDSKIGKFSPGMHIPIVAEGEGFNESVDCAFLGAWNYK
jgi:SAM-dependent methyltransferase